MKQTIKTIIFLALMILTAGQAIGQDLGYIICNPSDLDGGSLTFYKGKNSEQGLVNQISIDATTHKSGNLSSSDLESNRVYILATADETHQNYHVTITVEKKVDSGDSYPPDVPLWDDEINAPQFRAPSNNELTVTPVSYGIYYFEMPDDGSNVSVSATWTQPYTIQDSNNATITNVEVGTETTTVTIPATVSDGTNDVPVTSIADGTFTQENTANVQSIDLSNTSVDLDMDRKADNSPVKNVPDNTLIYLPAGSTMTGDNVIIKDGSNFTCENFVMTDNKSYSVPHAFTADNATLNRVFTANQTCTVCLPYDVPAANIPGKIYTFTSIANNQVTMTEDDDGLNANVPYVFVPNGADNISTTGSITVQITGNNTTADEFTFKGIYEDHTFTTEEIAKGIYGFAGANAVGATPGHFAKAATGAYIKGMRAYLEYTGSTTDPGLEGSDVPVSSPRQSDLDNPLPNSMDVILVNADGTTTNIGKMELIDNDDAPRYNLSGQRVGKSHKGIVIKNSKMMVIK